MDEQQLNRDIGEIKGSLRALTEEVSKLTVDHERRLNNHADRLSKAERWQSRINGMVALLVTVPGIGWVILKIKEMTGA